MQTSRIFMQAVLCSILLAGTSSFAAQPAGNPRLLARPSNNVFRQLASPLGAALAGLFVSGYHLWERIPVVEKKWNENPDNQYNLRDILKINKIVSKEYWKNIKNTYFAGWVGQMYKSKSIKLNDDERLKVHDEDRLPHGVLGTVSSVCKTAGKSFESTSSLLWMYFLLTQRGVNGALQEQINKMAGNAPGNHVPVVD